MAMDRIPVLCFLVCLGLPAAGKADSPAEMPALTLKKVADGLDKPVGLETAPGDPERLYVVEQDGLLRVIQNGKARAAPFLNISKKISRSHQEQGLLGLAFHPQFRSNRRFYVNYTDLNGDTVVSQWLGSPEAADPKSEKVILFQKQPFANHNGGQTSFGPDGYLYIAFGDGGDAGDPQNNGQNLGTLLGKILRIDVDSGTPYGIPKDNPFIKTRGARPEIWAWGLRNPWRFSFDTLTGRLYIADVGQDKREEIDVEELKQGGGKNYGWNLYEGDLPFNIRGQKVPPTVPPVLNYGHQEGKCSVTGGYVYRGRDIPALDGRYFYGDFCSGDIWSFYYKNGQAAQARNWTEEISPPGTRLSISSFGRDLQGEIYVLDYTGGAIYKLQPKK